MMSNELAEIFILFLSGGLSTFMAWLSWTRQQVTYHGKRYPRADSPFVFWFLLSLHIFLAAFLFILGIAFSISLLRSSW